MVGITNALWSDLCNILKQTDHTEIIPLCTRTLFIAVVYFIVGFACLFYFPLWVYRCIGGAKADLCVYTVEDRDWSEGAIWWTRGSGVFAPGQPLAWTDTWSLWNLQRKSTRWLPVSKYFVLPHLCWKLHFASLGCLCVCACRSPAGMIEGTPQLHANAWKVSSACVAPVNLPIIDPCEMNQNNGNNGFIYILFRF